MSIRYNNHTVNEIDFIECEMKSSVVSLVTLLTQCGIVTPYGDIEQGQLWRHQADDENSDGTKPLPEPMLTNHYQCPVTITWRQFTRNISAINLQNLLKNTYLKKVNFRTRVNELNIIACDQWWVHCGRETITSSYADRFRVSQAVCSTSAVNCRLLDFGLIYTTTGRPGWRLKH